MPFAKEIWFEQIGPEEPISLVAAFDLGEQSKGDPSRHGRPFVMDVHGIGEVVFSFVCCLKGQAIYSASLSDPAVDQGRSPEPARLLCRALLKASP